MTDHTLLAALLCAGAVKWEPFSGATDHPHDQPHNQQSLHYQYSFYATHGRWPTWTDAMAHCTDEKTYDLMEQKPTGR